MKAFLASVSGRILFAAFAFAIAGVGVAKLLGPGALGLAAITTFIGIAVAVFALATAIEEHPVPAALSVLILPWLLFLGELGQGLVSSSSAGYAMVIAGLASAALAMRPSPSSELAPVWTLARRH
jgi:hypothetical protein